MNKPYQSIPIGEQTKAVRRQELMAILVNIGIFSLGIGFALPAVTLRQLTDPAERIHLNDSQASWFACVNFMICPLGALANVLVLDKIGRKKTVIVINCVAMVAWVLMALALQDDTQAVFIQLMVSRCITGISLGLGSAPTAVYGAEISVPKIRGRLAMGTAIAATFGILFIYTLGYFIREDYHQIACILICFQIVSLVALIPVLETPSWLLSVGREVEAKESLTYFRGLDPGETHEEVEAEFAVLRKSVHNRTVEKMPPFHEVIRLPEVYKPLLIMCGLFLCQQCSGIFVFIAYAVEIATQAGVHIDPLLCAVIIGLARVVTIFILILLLEIWGRRLTLMVSASIMAITMFLLAGYGWFTWLRIPYLPVMAIVLNIAASTMGLHTLPFFMIAEVYPQRVRGACAGITGSFALFLSFIAIKSYPSMVHSMGSSNLFALYGISSLLAILYAYILVPETRGKTLLEIEEYFRTGGRHKEADLI